VSIGDIRIYRGTVTDHWRWEVAMDNSGNGRKVGGWASSRELGVLAAMNEHIPGQPPEQFQLRDTDMIELRRQVADSNSLIRDLFEQIGGMNNLLRCDDDCYHAPMCVRWVAESDASEPCIPRCVGCVACLGGAA